jgi:putative ATP-dependent endonuclease of OLD family
MLDRAAAPERCSRCAPCTGRCNTTGTKEDNPVNLERLAVSGFRSLAVVPALPVGSPTLLTGHNDAGKTALLDATAFLLGQYTLGDRDRTYLEPASRPGTRPAERTGDWPAETMEPTEPTSVSAQRVEQTVVEGHFSLSQAEQDDLGVDATVRLRRRSVPGQSPVVERWCSVPAQERLRGYANLRNEELQQRIDELGLTAEGTTKPKLLACLDAAAAGADRVEAWELAHPALVKAMPKVMRLPTSGAHQAERAIKEALSARYEVHLADPDLTGTLSELEAGLQERLSGDAADLRAYIRDRCPDIGSVSIVPEVSFTAGLKHTHVEVVAREGEQVRLSEAGAGRARRVAMAVWQFLNGLLSAEGAPNVVLLFDEPDTHLDYRHQRELMALLRQQCELPNVRMLVATHSMNLIDGVDITSVVHVKHVEHRTVLEQLTDDTDVGQHLGAVAASLGLRNTVLLHERLFVGVEGVTEQTALPVLFRLATGLQLESHGIALWACRNNEGAMDFADFLHRHNRRVVFVVDKDSKTAPRSVFTRDKLRARGLDPETQAFYLGDTAEFEDLFVDEQWTTVANRAWPRTDGRQWTPEDFNSLRAGKFSSKLLEELKEQSLSGPQRKSEVAKVMALSLTDPTDVPQQLRQVFDELIALAEGA